MAWEEGCEVGCHTNRAHARSATAVGDAECFVQIKMANISTDDSWTGQAHLRVHIRTVHVHLPPSIMDHVNDLHNLLLKHSKGTRISHHERSHVLPVLLHLRTQILQINITLVVVVHHHHLHSRHARARRIGPVRALGNETDVTMPLSDVFQVILDGEQSRVFASGATVRLGAHGREARDLRQVLVQVLNELVIPLHLIMRREGVNIRKCGPRHGDHLRGGVELHGTRSKRDHRVIQRQITIFKGFQIAEHLCLGVMLMEDGMGQYFRFAGHRGVDLSQGNVRRHVGGGDAKRSREEGRDIITSNTLAHGNANICLVHNTDIGARLRRTRLHLFARHTLARNVHSKRVKERPFRHCKPLLRQLPMRHPRQRVNPAANGLQPLGSVINRVTRRHVRQQSLGSAYITRRLVPTNVLFPRLHRHS
mmetsp:Transcript_11199/g.24277  ORF Transcript_11199/g.24277 Transcript_11199/m.24277 type:complete len:422 (-) Transcript_11199:679-1944(-)